MAKTIAKNAALGLTAKLTIAFLWRLSGLIIVWSVRLAIWMAVQGWRHPRTTTGLVTASLAVALLGWQWCLAVLLVATVVTSTWHAAHRSSYDRCVGRYLDAWWARWWTYGRCWARIMTRAGLTVEEGDRVLCPRIARLSRGRYWDTITVEIVAGAQELGQYREAQERLRGGLRVSRLRVREVEPAGIQLDVMVRDPLVETVSVPPLPTDLAAVDFRRLPVAIDEFGEEWCLSVLGGHTSVAGTSGAGKSGVEWMILRSLAPAIAHGLVRVVAIDPKAKELSQGRAIFAPEDYVRGCDETDQLLARLVSELADRNAADADSGERDFEPSPARPLTLILIDELAPLLDLWDRRARQRIEDSLKTILTQGRAAGFIVLGEIQEPTKDVFSIRDLFTYQRICLRVPTEAHVDAALCDEATRRGARSHEIRRDLPGTFYALDPADDYATRARLPFVQAEHIMELVDYVLGVRSGTVVSLDAHRRGADVGRVAS